MFDKRNCEKRYDFYSIKKRREEKFTFQLKSHFQSRKMICEQRERKSERQRKKATQHANTSSQGTFYPSEMETNQIVTF